MKHGRALNMNRSSYLRARALADRVITETLKRDPDRVVRAITFVVESCRRGWSVSLVANGGLCGSGTSSTLMVQNGSVRAGGSGVSVSGQVGPSGSVSLALQKSGVQGTASGKLSAASGSGSWSVSSLGCSGHWTARRA